MTSLCFVGQSFLVGAARRYSRAAPYVKPRRCCGNVFASAKREVGRETVRKTAHLARLSLSDEEVDQLTPDFRKIFALIDTLSELDVEGVEPMARVEDSTNVLRDDVPSAFPHVDEILEQAPILENDCIWVPRIGADTQE